MALNVTGVPQGFSSWSVAEDATSLDRSESPSGTPAISVSGVGPNMDVMMLKNREVKLTSSDYGRWESTILSANVTDQTWSVTGGSPLSELNRIGTVAYGDGLTALTAVNSFVKAPGFTYAWPSISIDSALANRTFTVPSYTGNIWTNFRQWLSANELDIAWILGTLYVTPMRTGVINVQDVTGEYSITLEDSAIANRVDVDVYHTTKFTSKTLVFPAPESQYPEMTEKFADSSQDSIMSVDAAAVTTAEFKLGAYVNSIYQPSMVESIPVTNGKPDTSKMGNGIYMIVGNDNKRITVAQWKSMGGGLSVKLNPDKHSVTVTLSGMNYAPLSPYRLCESDGEKDYPGLFLFAPSGQFVDVERIKFDTGVGSRSEDVTTISNYSIVTKDQAYRAAQAAADTLTGHRMTLSWRGADPVRSSFGTVTRQAFGRIAGQRFYLRGHWWRATSVTYNEAGVAVEATKDITLADISRAYNSPSALVPAGRSLQQLGDYGVL